jgi:hypothetical protein
LDETAAYVLSYIAKKDYYPRYPGEAEQRFYEEPPRGLTEPECQALVPEIEIRLNDEKRKIFEINDYIEFTNISTLEITS